MAASIQTRGFVALTALVAIVGFAGSAEAGWVTIKNDTNQAIVIQETMHVNGLPKQGRPVRLLPGETIREFHASGNRTIEVFDGQSPIKAICSSTIKLRPGSQSFVISTSGRTIQIAPVTEPPVVKK